MIRFIVFLVCLFCSINISAQINFIDSINVNKQARSCIWNEDGTYFGIANKNGKIDSAEAQIWKMNWMRLGEANKIWNFPGAMVLDYGWNGRYLAIAGYSDSAIVIYDIELDDTWYDNVVKVIDAIKCHQLEWAHNGDFLIYEILNEGESPDDSDLGIFDCSSASPSEWELARFIDTPGEIDKFQMDANNGYLSYESNGSGENDYKVHIWDISSNKYINWYEKYTKDEQRGGAFSPCGNYFVTRDAECDNIYIYNTFSGELERQIIAQGNGVPVFSPNSDGINSGWIALAGDSFLAVVDIVTWNVTYDDISIYGGGCSFRPDGCFIAIYESFYGDCCAIYSFDYYADVVEGTNETLDIKANPNPFSSNIDFYIKGLKSNYEVFIYDINGRIIKKFENVSYRFSWDGRNMYGNEVVSGVYFCRFLNDSKEKIIKAVKVN